MSILIFANSATLSPQRQLVIRHHALLYQDVMEFIMTGLQDAEFVMPSLCLLGISIYRCRHRPYLITKLGEFLSDGTKLIEIDPEFCDVRSHPGKIETDSVNPPIKPLNILLDRGKKRFNAPFNLFTNHTPQVLAN